MFAPAAAQPLVPEGESLAPTLEAVAELLAEVKPRQAIYALDWHPDGKELVTGGAGGTVTLWDLETGLEKRRLEDSSRAAVQSLTYSPDGRWLASGSDAGIVRVWDLTAGGRPRLYDGWVVAFSSRGSRLAIGSRDGVVTIVDPQAPAAEPLSWPAHSERIAALAWHPDGTALATGSWDRTVKLWSSSDGSSLRRLNEDHGERVNAVSWSPEGDLLASASADSTVRIWDRETGKELRRFNGHRIAATAVVWHPDGDTVASASHDGTVRLWSYVAANDDNEVARVENYGGKVFAVGFNSSGSLLASGTEEGFVGLWSFSSGQLVRRLGGEANPVEALAFADRVPTLAAGSKGVIQVWAGHSEPPQAPSMLTLAGGRAPRCLALGGEGEMLAAGFQDGAVAWWRREDDGTRPFERQAPLPAHTSAVAALAFSPNGEILAAGFDDGTIQVWDLATRELHSVFEYPHTEDDPRRQRSQALAFSADSQRLMAGFAKGSLYLWNLEPKNFVKRWKVDGDPVAVAFTSLTRVIAALREGDVFILDTARNMPQPAGRLEHRLNAAAFGPGGETLATSSDRECMVRVVSRRSPGTFVLSRVLLGGSRDHWVDCRPEGRCYRYDDGMSLLRRNSAGGLEPVPLTRSAAAPDLQLVELSQEIEVADGEVKPITLKLRNPGPQRAVWVNVRQASMQKQDSVVFYPPPVQVVVEPGKRIDLGELGARVSLHSAYEEPATEPANLELVVTSAGGKHLFLNPVRVTNKVAAVEWRGAWMSFGGERLSVDLGNTGDGPFPADRVALRLPHPLGPIVTDSFRDLIPGQKVRFDWELSPEVRANLPRRPDFVVYKTQLPMHRWSFESQRVRRFPFDRPWLYLLLVLALLVAVYARRRLLSWWRRVSIGRQGRLHRWVGDPKAEYAHLAIVFTDIVDSTQMLHDIKTAAWKKVRNEHFDRTDTLSRQFGGLVVKLMGDGCMVAFRSSIDALKFSVELENQPGHDNIRVRIGIHVGQVQIDRDDAHGPVVNLASRVMDIAEEGGVLVSNQVKADYDSAFQGGHHPYLWMEIPDREISDFAGQGSLWLVRYRPEAHMEA